MDQPNTTPMAVSDSSACTTVGESLVALLHRVTTSVTWTPDSNIDPSIGPPAPSAQAPSQAPCSKSSTGRSWTNDLCRAKEDLEDKEDNDDNLWFNGPKATPIWKRKQSKEGGSFKTKAAKVMEACLANQLANVDQSNSNGWKVYKRIQQTKLDFAEEQACSSQGPQVGTSSRGRKG